MATKTRRHYLQKYLTARDRGPTKWIARHNLCVITTSNSTTVNDTMLEFHLVLGILKNAKRSPKRSKDKLFESDTVE